LSDTLTLTSLIFYIGKHTNPQNPKPTNTLTKHFEVTNLKGMNKAKIKQYCTWKNFGTLTPQTNVIFN